MPTKKQLEEEISLPESIFKHVEKGRACVQQILQGSDSRRLAIVGPCSVHDFTGALLYAEHLLTLAREIQEKIVIVMRVYIAKPRTLEGWKGLLLDPDLNGTYQFEKGLRLCRQLLKDLNHMGIFLGLEFLDPNWAGYFENLYAWASIGARTCESPLHREMASDLLAPVGFKNNMYGDLLPALYGIKVAQKPHAILKPDETGRLGLFLTKGNPHGHLVLRGGIKPNFSFEYQINALRLLEEHQLQKAFIIDCSHGNCEKDYLKQLNVLKALKEQITQEAETSKYLKGFMLESYLNEGRQPLQPPLKPGISITDSCLSFAQTKEAILRFCDAL